MSIKQRLQKITDEIEKACKSCGRPANDITLVAISKTKPEGDILEAYSAGQIHFGENRAKELQDKMEQIKEDDIQWHFVGNLQTNKIKYMVERVNWIESIHKKKALKEVEKRASEIGRHINVLIQVNISDEDQKSGCDPEDLGKILEYGQDLKFTHVRGLMGMATFTEDLDKVRSEFKLLHKLREEHRDKTKGNVTLEHLSMGMSNDFQVAIEEGSTMVRVGTAIFGERNY